MRKENKKTIHINWICMVGVIFVHTYNIVAYGLNHSSNSIFVQILKIVETLISEEFGNNIAVPLFMILSGYHFFSNITKPEVLVGKVKKRARSLIIPYLFWNCIGCIYFLLIARLPYVSSLMNGAVDELNVQNIVMGVFCYKYYFPFWFLARLIIFVAVSPMLYYILRNKKPGLLIIGFMAVLFVFDIGLDRYTSKSLLFYLIGGMLSIHGVDWFENRCKDNWQCVITICLIIGVMVQFLAFPRPVQKAIQILMPLVFWKAADYVDFESISIMKYERLSFYVYCSHILVLETIEKVIGKVIGINIVGAYIDYFLAPVVTVVILILIYRILYKVFPKFTSLICGGRVA